MDRNIIALIFSQYWRIFWGKAENGCLKNTVILSEAWALRAGGQ